MNWQMDQLKKNFFSMCGKVEESAELSVTGLLQGNLSHFEQVSKLEKEINHLHMEVDDECFKYIALKQPVAKELRFILSCIKANTDLERIGDQAVNISQTSTLLVQNRTPILREIQEMSKEVLTMLHESLDSFIKADLTMATSVFRREKTVNSMKRNIFKKVVGDLKNKREKENEIEDYLEFLLISRNLERIGDHSQNITEYLIFMEEGKDIRHSGFFNGEETYDKRKA